MFGEWVRKLYLYDDRFNQMNVWIMGEKREREREREGESSLSHFKKGVCHL
jgi:hypothetical protein